MLNNPLPNKDLRKGTFFSIDLILNYAANMHIPNPLNLIINLHHEERRKNEEKLERCNCIDDNEYK